MKSAQLPDILDYFDYREYLRDWFEQGKMANPELSHRSFLDKAGIGGSTYLLRVINGDRRLSPGFVPNFTRALGLVGKDRAFFELLVQFNNRKNVDRKNELLGELLKIRKANPHYTLEDKKLRYFQKWYYPVIRDLVALVDFGEDYSLLARLLKPPIKARQAQSAVSYLLKNGFIKKASDGTYEPTEPIVATPPRVHSTVLSQFHKKNLRLNLDAYEFLPADQRAYSSVTMSVSEKTFEKVREEIHQFRQRLLAMARGDHSPERIVHVGFQLLPRTRDIKRGKR